MSDLDRVSPFDAAPEAWDDPPFGSLDDPPPADQGWPPPPASPSPSGRRPRPTGEGAGVTAVIVAVIVALGALKLALFTVGGALAAWAVGAVFVAAHGAALAAGAAWFWPHRYGA